MKTKRRKFTREFKEKAVELSKSRENVKELAYELEIRPELLYRWRKEYSMDPSVSFTGNGNKKMNDKEREMAELRKELHDVKMERDILKKAVGIFSVSDGKSSDS